MSSDPAKAHADADADATPRRLSSYFGNTELVIVVLLGIVSVATAYASFQSALYGSQVNSYYAQSTRLTAEAESAYLEGNQQYAQDSATIARLLELDVEMDSADPVLAQLAAEKHEMLSFVAVSADLAAAIAWADAENATDPDLYTPPQNDSDYLQALFGGWNELNDDAAAATIAGDTASVYGDRLTLNTVLFAVSLFLLGVAAVLKNRRSQYALIGISSTIFVGGLALTVTVPFVSF